MSNIKHPRLVKGISTSVLFDMSEPNHVFETGGPEAYLKYMAKHAEEPLPLGPYFDQLKSAFNANSNLMEMVICSRNSPVAARRAILTLANHGITPERMMFTSGKSPVPFLKAYGISQFHTTNYTDAVEATQAGVYSTHHDLVKKNDPKVIPLNGREKHALAQVETTPTFDVSKLYNDKAIWEYVCDLDGVLFDQESENLFQEEVKKNGFAQGLENYRKYQKKMRKVPMPEGPAINLIKRATDINASFSGEKKPFIISIATAQGAEAAVRAIETFHAWGIEFNGYAHFLAGDNKRPILEIMKTLSVKTGVPCEFMDDQDKNVSIGHAAGMFSGRVPGFGGS